MIRNYPLKKPSSAPSTGKLFYEFLMNNISIPAAANHSIWYAGAEEQLKHPTVYAFRGNIPIGKTLELVTLQGKPVQSPYTLTGKEGCILVSDLSTKAREELGIPPTARDKDKVYNSNYKPFEELDPMTKWSNQLSSLSVPKSISSYLAGVEGKVNYSERDVLKFLEKSFEDLSSPQAMHLLHGNHLAWSALDYIRANGQVAGNLMTEFHGQNSAEFYAKDLGTVLPMMFFALANLGQDPLKFFEKLDIEVYGAKDAAEYMRGYMPQK